MPWRYAALEERFKRLSAIDGSAAILHWDTAVMMPKGAVETRGEQLAALKRVAHDLLTSDETGELLANIDGADELDPWQRANVREMERRYRQARALEPTLVEALSRATTTCEMTWREAREKSDFAMLLPSMQQVLDLVRETGQALGGARGLGAYDALLDEHQPDLRDAMIEPLFDELARELPPLLERALAQVAASRVPSGRYDPPRQKELAKTLMARLGFDFTRGRLDESTHPFCGGVPDDIRITTRYREDEVASALMGVLHETGHALYEKGLPAAWRHQPVGEARGIGIHESQSLFLEMQICRSPAFLRLLGGELATAFGDDPAFAPDNLTALYHRVERSLIRVDADEVTYPLHIILRWRLERALLSGDLPLSHLPGAWNDAMQELLGVRPPDDARGCLQDIHWPVGAIGYFPNYTIGSLLAAQLYRAMSRELGDLRTDIEAGRFERILDWLQRTVHARASSLSFDELIEASTGGPLTAEPFLCHLRERYIG